MTTIEELLSRRYVIRNENNDLYYRVKDDLKDIKKIMREKFGYIIIVNQQLIKLEKIPSKAEPWMGIQEFTTIRDYQMFCFILMFLEDMEKEEQFVLSMLTEYIQVQFKEGEIDWTHFSTRRQLIRVIKFCIQNSLIKNNDGDEDLFSQDVHSEVLYENTGISRYFLRNFTTEILEYETPQDFEKSEWFNMDEDRGIIRRQRIYRHLLLSPGIYLEKNNEDDFLYLRNYRNQITQDFSSYFSSDVHIHQSSAYVVLGDTCSMGKIFPSHNTMHDLILIVFKDITREIKNKHYKMNEYEQTEIEKEKFLNLISQSLLENVILLPKKYQEIPNDILAKQVMQEMNNLGFIVINENVFIYPICGKLDGEFSR